MTIAKAEIENSVGSRSDNYGNVLAGAIMDGTRPSWAIKACRKTRESVELASLEWVS